MGIILDKCFFSQKRHIHPIVLYLLRIKELFTLIKAKTNLVENRLKLLLINDDVHNSMRI